MSSLFFCQEEDGIRDLVRSRGLGDVYKRQVISWNTWTSNPAALILFTNINSLIDNFFNPERSYTRQAIRLDLEKALHKLPDEQRYAFEKNELEGRTFREMADETGENINTLLARKRYAVIALRKDLQDHYEYIKN